jgi:hypothetical protein
LTGSRYSSQGSSNSTVGGRSRIRWLPSMPRPATAAWAASCSPSSSSRCESVVVQSDLPCGLALPSPSPQA